MNTLKVNCYSGHTYAERPRSFTWEGKEYEVEKIEKSWQEPGERHFQVRTRDNKTFRVCYNEMKREWSLTELLLKDSLKKLDRTNNRVNEETRYD